MPGSRLVARLPRHDARDRHAASAARTFRRGDVMLSWLLHDTPLLVPNHEHASCSGYRIKDFRHRRQVPELKARGAVARFFTPNTVWMRRLWNALSSATLRHYATGADTAFIHHCNRRSLHHVDRRSNVADCARRSGFARGAGCANSAASCRQHRAQEAGAGTRGSAEPPKPVMQEAAVSLTSTPPRAFKIRELTPPPPMKRKPPRGEQGVARAAPLARVSVAPAVTTGRSDVPY